MHTNAAPDNLSSAEVCSELSIDRSTLSRWVAAGKIAPAFKLPGLRGPFVFTRDEVDRVRAEDKAQAS